MEFVVKNTISGGWLDLLCPHTCRGCGRLGAIICECCKNDLLKVDLQVCPLCKQSLAEGAESGKKLAKYRCADCELPFEAIFAGGWRQGALDRLVKDFKYHAARAAGGVLVELLDKVIPELMGEVVVVPLPTIGKHVRARGIDHTLVLGKKLARRRDWTCRRILQRAADTVQVGTKMAARQTQADRAYAVTSEVVPEPTYLLLDDIWTTGASLLAAERVLRRAGAAKIMAVVIAISPSKKPSSNCSK